MIDCSVEPQELRLLRDLVQRLHLARGGYLLLDLSEPIAPPPAVRSLGQSVYNEADRI